MRKIKFPYGVSNFAKIAEEGLYFVDKTHFIEELEDFGGFYLSFLRPRRMGKSLFVSILEHYYGIEYKDKFDTLFGNYYIGKNPTPLANQYHILKFDFSAIDTRDATHAEKSFNQTISEYARLFIGKYRLFDEESNTYILSRETASEIIKALLTACQVASVTVYLIIDEYDHFTNEILTQDLKDFKKAVTRNGYVRKFYEAVKVGTQQGIIDRIFITGVSSVTLDSLTSGFNIATHLSNELAFHDMMGFTEEEVSQIIDLILQDPSRKELIMSDLKLWYNGYRFHEESEACIYNSDMVLYFCMHFQRYQKYPKEMLDMNIAPDYGKLRAVLSIQNTAQNYELVEKILYEQSVESSLVRQFSFEIEFDNSQFISLLYYMGFLTISKEEKGLTQFTIPNYVIKELYWGYFAYLIRQKEALTFTDLDVQQKVAEMTVGNLMPFIELLTGVLEKLSNRDYQNFDEKYIKVVMMSFLAMAGIYFLKSEYETSAGYTDLILLAQPQKNLQYEYLFELKYIKKGEASEANIQAIQAEAKTQILQYLEVDEFLRNKQNLLAYTLVFVKNECLVERIQID